MSSNDLIDELKSNNSNYSSAFSGEGVPGKAGKKLLILTCMDSRIKPHEIFGLDLGDVKVVRNAGGQLNPEVEKDIVLASGESIKASAEENPELFWGMKGHGANFG